jgi:hypothetical protein
MATTKQNECKKCGALFPNWLKIDGKWVGLAGRSYCLDCSPRGSRNRKILKNYDGDQKHCLRCDVWKSLDAFHAGVSRKTGKSYPSSVCRSCSNEQSKEFARAMKRQAIHYKGGLCCDCHQAFHDSVYDFHHRDPSQKDFIVSDKKSCDWSMIKDELDKCVLLCSNCHRSRHFDSSNPNFCPHV